MAWVNPSTRAVGAVVTASIWNQDVVANSEFLAKPPSCSLLRTTELSQAAGGGWRSIAWQSEQWDTDTMWSSTAATRIDINTPGKYEVQALITWTTNASAQGRAMGIYAGAVGSSTVAPNQAEHNWNGPALAGFNPTNMLVATLSLTSTSTIRIQTAHNSTSAITIRHTTAGQKPRVSVRWVSS